MRRGNLGGEGGSEEDVWVTPAEVALSGRVIAAAIAVHRTLGPGFVEGVYQGALECELGRRGLRHASQVDVMVRYETAIVGRHRLDLLIEPGIIVELKAVGALERIHFAQLRSYLKAAELPFGLLLNFGECRLVVRRVVVRSPFAPSSFPSPSPPTLPRLSD